MPYSDAGLACSSDAGACGVWLCASIGTTRSAASGIFISLSAYHNLPPGSWADKLFLYKRFGGADLQVCAGTPGPALCSQPPCAMNKGNHAGPWDSPGWLSPGVSFPPSLPGAL